MSSKIIPMVAYALRETSKSQNLLREEVDVRPAFPYNPESKTSPATAIRWASGVSRYSGETGADPEIVIRQNEPFEITIMSLDYRGNGGRAYRVCDEQKHVFDLREDQLVDAISKVGIAPGGKINGKFVWGIDSQLKLLLVGGDVHHKLTVVAEEIKNTTIMPSKLKRDTVYETPTGYWRAFIGRCKLVDGRKYYAFWDVPNWPTNYEAVGYAAASEEWEKLSDVEKIARGAAYNLTSPSGVSIKMTTTPKFIKELAPIDLSMLRNPSGGHQYCTHADYDLAETWYRNDPNNPTRPQFHYSYSYGAQRVADEARADKFRADEKAAKIKTKNEYGATIEWL